MPVFHTVRHAGEKTTGTIGTVRAFIAIETPETVRSALAELQRELRDCRADIRWVNPDNIHLTLKFLGDIEEKRIDRIVAGIRGSCKGNDPFRLEVRGLGLFPNLRSPRVLWADVLEEGSLTGLQGRIEDAMDLLGFKSEKRRYSPHLTVGRFRSQKGKDRIFQGIEQHNRESFGTINVHTVTLMKSRLEPAGAVYSRLAVVPLRRTGDVGSEETL